VNIREENGFPVFDVPANAPLITMEMVLDIVPPGVAPEEVVEILQTQGSA